ncbi:MAG: PBP1A family penicillin-binding protein, partial [Acetobacteraceae bacterium]|nr:PBP1A family penicillin-binding protein [Acetobacteraceae bacterium]
VAGWAVVRSVAGDLPDYRWLADYEPPQMSRIYAADSRLMAELAAERRVFVPLEAIPRRVQQAFVSAEDQRFWDHQGVDPIGIGRAVITALEQYGSGRRMSGASTITQQVAKNMLVGADRTMARKVREAILAFRIEQALSKERILELYLNEIFLGAQAYGVAAAAQAYFNKPLDELTLAEAAFLGALPKAPNNYNPVRFPEAAKVRRDWVLDRMAEDGAITAAEAAAAKAEPLVPRPTRRPEVLPVGQYFTEEVRRELIGRFPPQPPAPGEEHVLRRSQDPVHMGGLVVRTSLDPALQGAAEAALRNALTAYDRRRGGWRGPVARIPFAPTAWLPALAEVERPGGALPDWRLAVVLELRGNEARLGLIDRPEPRGPAQPRTASLALEDATWARRALENNRLAGAPRRIADVVAPGDVILVEAVGGAARPERMALRQIPAVEGAIVALDPNTGRVRAMVGGWSFDKSQFNRASQALRQPGSSFKPFVYLTALEAGIPPNQRFLDGPFELQTAQGVWRPTNYGGGTGAGYVTIRTALEKSYNLVTVRVAQEIGMDRVAEVAERFGIVQRMPRYLAMSLGAGETTVLRMAAGYAAFVNGGREVTPTFIDTVQDHRGRLIARSDIRRCQGCDAAAPGAEPPDLVGERRELTDPVAAFQMAYILRGVVQRGTGTRAVEGFDRNLWVAGKTGTTDDYKDAWFVGFTANLVIAVWIGFDDPRSLRAPGETGQDVTGGRLAAPVFRAVLAEGPPAYRGVMPFTTPPGVSWVSRVPLDGGGAIEEAFKPGTETAARGPRGEGGGTAGLDRGIGGLY